MLRYIEKKCIFKVKGRKEQDVLYYANKNLVSFNESFGPETH